MRRTRAVVALLLVASLASVIYAANVLVDSNMEAAGIGSWTLVNVTGVNTSAKATDWKVSGAQSLKGTSAAGKAITVEWYNWQTAGTINPGDTVTLSLQYAFLYSSVQGGVLGTFYADLSPDGTNWTNVWTQAITPSLTRTAGSVTALDVSSAIAAGGTYRLRIRFNGRTGNVNGATINTWLDDVLLDVLAGVPPVTTVGDGAVVSNASACPGDGAQALDAFTLQTNTGTDAISSATVTLSAGSSAALSLVEITSDGGAQLASVANPASDVVTIPVSITATTTLTQYRVRVTPKTQAGLAGTTSYNVTGRVTAVSSPDPKTYGDSSSGTVTIDNTPTANAAWATNSAGDGSVTLNWTNPAASDFAQVVILRNTTTPIADAPADGNTYAPGDPIGSSIVRYAGALTTFPDTAVTNGTTYYYKIFAKDGCGNYASGVESGALDPRAISQTTTVGDGTDPSASSTCPGGAARIADAFTLQTTAGTDTVDSVSVALSSGSAALSLVEIVDDAEAAVYGSLANPPSNGLTIPTSGLSATATLTPYKVRITPQPEGVMPAGSYTISATVTAVSSTNPKNYQDVDGSAVTIDNAAPANASWSARNAGDAAVSLAWTRPADAASVLILRSATSPIAATPADGASYAEGDTIGTAVVRYAGSALSFDDTPLTNGSTYHYKLFARDACGNYSTGVESGALVPSGTNPKLAAGLGIGTVDSCNQITVRAPFSGDVPSNSTTTFERAASIGGPWTAACTGVIGASPRTCAMSVTAGSTSYIRVTFSDADGVTGQNPQIVGPFTTPSICAQTATTAGAATAQLSACKQIVVTAPFSGDGDGDGSLRVEFNTSNSWPGTVACAAASGPSPRQCMVTGVNASTQYWLRATWTDPDGVSGSSVQVLGPLTTSACGADAAAPMILFLAPAREAVIGGTERVKVQVWDGGGLVAAGPVQWSLDGGALANATASMKYTCGAGCAVYEFDVNTSPLANGAHSVTVQATDLAGNVGRASQPLSVNNNAAGSPHGGGRLLRRTHSSQLCSDCHAIASHTSQSAGSTKYGSWANDCLSCHTAHLTTNVELIRTQILTPNSGPMTVDLRTVDKSGGSNPQSSLLGAFDASGAPFNDGVCEVCHTKTTHYRNDASGGDHTHNQSQRCTGCHTHASGFKSTGCNGCHHAPPAIGKHRTKHDEVWDSTQGNSASSYDDGASHATATQYGFACASCHAGSHANDDSNPPHDGTQSNPWQVEVAFQGLNGSATYGATYDQNREQGPGGSYFSWSNGTCANGYCHSNAAPLGGLNVPVSVTWNGGATTCASCHKTGAFGDGANDNTFLSKSHARHIRSTLAETGTYAYRCDACHAAVIASNGTDPWNLNSADLKDKRLHVNESKQDVAFAAVGTADQSGGTYDGAARTCGSTYCHSQGTSTTSFAAPNSAIAWGQTATCVTCHDGNATHAAADRMTTGKHAQHVDIAATFGQNIGCATCHAATLTADETLNATTGHATHVNGARDVSGTSAGTWTTPTCASSRCHSSGVRAGTLEYYTMNWATGAAITDCKGCHGRHTDNAFASVAGEPNYTNAPASSKYNSHRAHVTAATNCHSCHASTVGTSNRIDGTNPAKHMDFDGLPDITFAAPYGGGTYDTGTRTCTVGCHGTGAPTWGGAAIPCLGCHSGAEGDALGNGIPNGVSSQWATRGHGSAAGGAFTSALNGCDYCHDLSASHTPASAANPYRLRFSAIDNTLCLKCHANGDAGIGVNSAGTNLTLEDSAKDVDDAHMGSKHQAGEGGSLCWDCHDPHGTPTNILMIRDNVALASSTYGVPSVTKPVTFTARATAADFIRTTGSPRTGICQACHDPGKGTDPTTGSTKYWRWDGTDAGGGASTHQSGTICTQCHQHNNNFAGAGGDCLGCHGTGSGAPGRRAVANDFADGTSPNFRSHHVGNSTTNTLRGTLTNFDCVVCHAEGKITAGATDTSGQPHGDGKIDLRNVDSTTAYFTYDKDAVEASAGATLAQWSSANAVWRTQTSTALDPFCLTCHDSNGASQIATLGETGATAANPFKDTTITNNYDQQNRGGVTDIKSKVTGAPPAQGTFSRHAIRGQSTSVYAKYQAIGAGYTSIYEFGGFTAMGTSENGNLWNDTSVMGCADCHTTDGANGTSGNAHGSSSEYLLKDASGGAAEGTLLGKNYNCYRCHAVGKYDTGLTHAPNANDYQDTTGLLASARTTSGKGGTIFGIACMNCHGGAAGFGWIHGTNQVLGVGQDGASGTRNAYRFMNGGSMRYYQPSNASWNAGPGSCYTLSTADSWGGCTQHSRNAGTGLTAPTRPLTY